ncbi:MAG: response regulator [Verrucomicrobiota bacterium]
MKTLIVDDSRIIRSAIERHLKHFQLEIVGTATNGVEALELFKEHLPDFVTLDITMPEMDGLACLREMMQVKPEARVLVMSALTDKPTILKALKEGAKGFLGKPITPDSFKEAVQKIITD